MIYKRCTCEGACSHHFEYAFELNGVRYRRSTKTSDRRIATRIEARRRAAILDNRDEDEQPSVSLRQHIADYKAHVEKKNRTHEKDVRAMQYFLNVTGDQCIRKVSTFAVEKWKRTRANEVSQSTVNRELSIVRACFNAAVVWKRITVNPVTAVQKYSVDDKRIRVLTDEEIGTLMRLANDDVRMLCRVTLECLPRLSEVLNIHRDHIGPSWVEVRRKGGRIDRLSVSAALRTDLLARCHPVTGYAFGWGYSGSIGNQNAMSEKVSSELKRLGIHNATHHTMRHTGVTLMLEAGVNPRVIQKLAGWTSLAMLERYGHARDAEAIRAVTTNAERLLTLTAAATTDSQHVANSAQ